MAYFLSGRANDPYFNLALEERLCAFAGEKAEPVLYLWQNCLCSVIGVNQNPWLECCTAEMERAGALLVRRRTGGGAVCHDLGNLNFSFCYPKGDFSQEAGNRIILSALGALGISAEATGRNDLCANGKKFSGSAFRHTADFSLHHGTLLVSSDLSLFSRLLTPDSQKLEAKGVRSVSSRVTNLCDHCPGLTVEKLKSAIKESFAREFGALKLLNEEAFDVSSAASALSDDSFRLGRTPIFSENISFRLPGGGINASIKVEKGIVSDCIVWTDALDTELPAKLKAALLGKPYSPRLVQAEAERLI